MKDLLKYRKRLEISLKSARAIVEDTQTKIAVVDQLLIEMEGIDGIPTSKPRKTRKTRKPRKVKRVMSAAVKAKLAKATKERWAKAKASGKNTL